MRDRVVANGSHPRHYKVNMKLEQILEGRFFSEYVKKGEDFSHFSHEIYITDIFVSQETFL